MEASRTGAVEEDDGSKRIVNRVEHNFTNSEEDEEALGLMKY